MMTRSGGERKLRYRPHRLRGIGGWAVGDLDVEGESVGDWSVSEQEQWPEVLPVARTRVARPTDHLREMRRFYGKLLGLPELGSFEGHAGYSGVFFGLPGLDHHLEFTQHESGSPCPTPTKDSLLVLYFTDAVAVDAIVERLTAAGHPPVEPENSYWKTTENSVTVEDPDGWRVVFVRPRG